MNQKIYNFFTSKSQINVQMATSNDDYHNLDEPHPEQIHILDDNHSNV